MLQAPTLILQNGSGKGHNLPLAELTTIGRDASCTITFNDNRVSRHHCQIWKEGENYKIKDLNSKNGIYVNNLRVTETTLSHGDTIQIGENILAFNNTEPNPVAGVSITPELKQTMVIHSISGKPNHNLQPELLTKLIQEKTIQDLTTLYHVSFSIYTIRDTNRLLTRVLELIFRTVPAERGVILLYDEKTLSLEPRASRVLEGVPKKEINISSTIINKAFNENIALLTKDASIDTRFDAKTSIVQEEIRSAMCIPIGTQKNTFGVIYLDTQTTTSAFNEDALRLITAISNQVAIAIENIHFHQELETSTNNLNKELQKVYNMVGKSKQIMDVFSQIDKVAQTDSNVLITGESGTGKELVARAIHYNSPRKNKPFICINCTALPETLIESELFGHEKGAFTNAYTTKPGQFELADGSTLFLDEIGEMPVNSQMKLLRVLEENKIRHVGGTKDIPVNVRVIAASNKELEKSVKEGKFREDLYYRLKVININIVPLRERKEDISLLAKYYFEYFKSKTAYPIKGISPEAIKMMEEYPWPGNIRQLKNSIERAIVMSRKDYIDSEDLDLAPHEPEIEHPEKICTLADIEKEHIIRVLKTAKGNKTKTAEILGIRRSTLYEKLKLYNIE
jgi:Nif-specific regulatory protein